MSFATILVTLAAAAACVQGSANLLVNGGFEANSVTPPWQYFTGASIIGWTSVPAGGSTGIVNYVQGISTGPVSEGLQAIQLERAGDYIEQSFATTIGVEYTVSFDLRGYVGNAGFRASVAGGDHDYTGIFGNKFTRHQFYFTATATTSTLRLSAITNNNHPHFDNVIVVVHKPRYIPADFRREYQEVVPLVLGTNRKDVRFDGWNYGQSSSIGSFSQFIVNTAVGCKSGINTFGLGTCSFVDATSAYPDASVGTAIRYRFRQNWGYGWFNGTLTVPNGNGVVVRFEYYSTVSSTTTLIASGAAIGGTEASDYQFWFLLDDVRADDIVTIVIEAGADNTNDLVFVDAAFTTTCDQPCTCFFCTPTYDAYCPSAEPTPIPTPAEWREDICNDAAAQCELIDCSPADDACSAEGGIFCTIAAQCLDIMLACWHLVEICLEELDGCPG